MKRFPERTKSFRLAVLLTTVMVGGTVQGATVASIIKHKELPVAAIKNNVTLISTETADKVTSTCNATLVTTALENQSDTGIIVVNKDPRIDLLIKKQIQINEATTRERRKSAPGFRIQVISTTDRNKAIEAKTRIYKVFPELKPYFLYQSPYYRLKVGNFLNREDAQEYINTLSREFPGGGVFIVRDTIERDPLDNQQP